MHTTDLTKRDQALLQDVGWTLRVVEYITASNDLFHHTGGRFDGVFTKLHVLSLTDYSKVLMLDLDLVILQNIDGLFTLEAPAAMMRGSLNQPAHGDDIEGWRFFAGEEDSDNANYYAFGQHGGINAGVMLLAPNKETYHRALREVTQFLHPERIPGAGPEQDYLSRLFAPHWTHIGVEYNFQLHQLFYAIEHWEEQLDQWDQHVVAVDDCIPWMPRRLSLRPKDIFV
eukprot:1953121-Karenia_brevis.AAC.1